MSLIYLSTQPAIKKYTWEVEVYLSNFLENKVDLSCVHIVLGYGDSTISNDWINLKNKFKDANFYFYPDTRVNNNYQPSIQAHILEKHWKSNKWLEKESVFFHDSDFIFTRPFDFKPFLNDDIWYLSDTISYIGAEYIKGKGEEVLDFMCNLANIEKDLVIGNEKGSGGAQKLIKNVPTEYWSDVFDLQMKFFNETHKVSAKIKKEKGKTYHELQHWTASMWAELWTAWKYGFKTEVPKEFDFLFYTNHIKDWDRLSFYHNAGVVNTNDGMFFKGMYSENLPYNKDLDIRTDLAGFNYYKLVQKVGKTSCL
jgi:hypothetical protein